MERRLAAAAARLSAGNALARSGSVAANRDASKGDCLAQDALADPRPQSLLGGDVDLAAQELLELDHESRVIQQAPALLEVDQEVQVALRPGGRA